MINKTREFRSALKNSKLMGKNHLAPENILVVLSQMVDRGWNVRYGGIDTSSLAYKQILIRISEVFFWQIVIEILVFKKVNSKEQTRCVGFLLHTHLTCLNLDSLLLHILEKFGLQYNATMSFSQTCEGKHTCIVCPNGFTLRSHLVRDELGVPSFPSLHL
jgi:hypothetical protein